jgi:SOS response regulatory protein OraA/RecX
MGQRALGVSKLRLVDDTRPAAQIINREIQRKGGRDQFMEEITN